MFSNYQVASIKNTLLFLRSTYSLMSQPTFLGGGEWYSTLHGVRTSLKRGIKLLGINKNKREQKCQLEYDAPRYC